MAQIAKRILIRWILIATLVPTSAISSAFAYASPGDKLVRIEALWGLPEGLYYYSHDKYLVDTKTVDLSKMSRDNFTVHDFRNYKKYFVLPMADGKWEEKFL